MLIGHLQLIPSNRHMNILKLSDPETTSSSWGPAKVQLFMVQELKYSSW